MAIKDDEVRAMSGIVQLMEPLDEDQQVRVSVYILDRFAPALLEQASPCHTVTVGPKEGGPNSAA